MRRSSIICALLTLAVAQAQNGYDYNRPSKPFDQSSNIRPGGFPVTTPGAYPSSQSSAGGVSSAFPNGSQGSGYPGPNATPIAASSSNQGYPGTISTGYPQGDRPPRPEFSGQGTSYPGQGGYEQNRPSNTIGPYPGQSTGQVGNNIEQGSGQTYPGQSTGQSYPGQESVQNYPGQGGGTNYPGEVNGQNFQGQIGSEIPSSEVGFVPLRPGSGSQDTGAYEGGDYSAIPGEPDRDYPILTEIPETSFRCDAQAYPGYYADVETRCQVFHVCANNRTYDFLCPNGTIFSQQVFVCVWWNQFDCNTAPSLYDLNANLYDYTIMGGGGFTGSLGDYSKGPQGPGLLGSTGIQGPSSNYPGNFSPQGPFTGVPSSSGLPGQPPSYPGSSDSQRPPNSIPIAPQISSTGYPVGTSGQRPSSGFTVTQGPSSTYPGSTGSQGPTGYPGGTGTQGTLSGYPDSANLQRPSVSYPTPVGSQGSLSGYPTAITQSPGYPGSPRPQETLSGYSTNGIQSEKPSSQRPTGFPGSQGTQNYQEYRPNIDNSQGYPSGKPTGPSFPLGPNEGRPIGSQGIQTGPNAQIQQPNREYLPPTK